MRVGGAADCEAALRAEVATGEVRREIERGGPVNSVAFSPDGTLLAAGDANREVCVWNVASREALVQGAWVFHSTRIMSVAFSPSGSHVASGALDEHIFLWEVPAEKGAASKRTQYPNAHRDGTNCVAFVDDSHLASAGQDGAAVLWKLD